MTDIVDRLWGLGLSVNVYDRQHGLMAEAAAEIERSRGVFGLGVGGGGAGAQRRQ